jgi:hypothetical protein
MIKRRRLGPVYELSPAQQTKNWLLERVFKVISIIVIWIIWLGVYYVFTGIYRFLSINLMQWNEPRSTVEIMRGPTANIIIIVGMIAIVLYVFRDPLRKKKSKR